MDLQQAIVVSFYLAVRCLSDLSVRRLAHCKCLNPLQIPKQRLTYTFILPHSQSPHQPFFLAADPFDKLHVDGRRLHAGLGLLVRRIGTSLAFWSA